MTKKARKAYKKNLKKQLAIHSLNNKDCFSIDEFGHTNLIEKYDNILEFDKADWIYQKEHETMMFANSYTDQLYLAGRNFRAIEYPFSPNSPRLVYGQLQSLEFWLATIVSDELNKVIDKKIPNILARKYKESIFTQFSMGETRANGLEKELALYKKKARELYPLLRHKARLIAKAYEGAVFRKFLDDGAIDDLEIFIVGGQSAASRIKFETFFENIYDLEQPYGVIKKVRNHFVREFKELVFSSADIGEIYTIYDQLDLLDD